ncbi:MAG: cysteine hydrolase family protein [Bryobacteraceae bacterium]
MKTVFFDVDTQLDFLFPAGALAVPGAERIVPALRTLTRFAHHKGIQIISTADAHTEDDPEFKTWKPHCVSGTVGQTKASGTLLGGALVVPPAGLGVSSVPDNLPAQVVVEKQSLDCFSNPTLEPLLRSISAGRYVVYGVATEYCVQKAVAGLLRTGATIELVEDAVCGIDEAEVKSFLARFVAAGGKITVVSEVTDTAR